MSWYETRVRMTPKRVGARRPDGVHVRREGRGGGGYFGKKIQKIPPCMFKRIVARLP